MEGAPTSLKHSKSQTELELLTAEHFDFFCRIYCDAGLMQHVNKPLDKTTAITHFQQQLSASKQAQPGKLTYLIRCAQAADYQGLVGLTWRPVERREQAFVGVVVLPEWRRQGVAHRAKQLIIKAAFEQLGVDEVVAHCDVTNLAANQANQKLGFVAGEIIHNRRKGMQVQEWYMAKK